MSDPRTEDRVAGRAAALSAVSLVVVNFRTRPLVERLAASLASQVREMIVVDNSADVDLDRLPDAYPRVRVERMPTNVGYGAAANRGAALASGDVLVVCNP